MKIITSAHCGQCNKITRFENFPVQTNHILHLILTIITGSLWAWGPWPIITIINHYKNKKLPVICTICGTPKANS